MGTIGYVSGHTGYNMIQVKTLLFDTISCTTVLFCFYLIAALQSLQTGALSSPVIKSNPLPDFDSRFEGALFDFLDIVHLD